MVVHAKINDTIMKHIWVQEMKSELKNQFDDDIEFENDLNELHPDISLGKNDLAIFVFDKKGDYEKIFQNTLTYDRIFIFLTKGAFEPEEIKNLEQSILKYSVDNIMLILPKLDDVKDFISNYIYIYASNYQNEPEDHDDGPPPKKMKEIVQSSFDLVTKESSCDPEHDSFILQDTVYSIYNLCTATKSQLLDCPLSEQVSQDITDFFENDYSL